MIMNPLPLVDLTEIQSQNLYNIPLNFMKRMLPESRKVNGYYHEQ